MSCKDECGGLSNALFKSVHAGIVVVSAGTKYIIAANPAACIMIGVSCEELVGKPCNQYLCMDSCDGCPVNTAGLDEGIEYVENKEIIIYRKDGTRIYALLTVSSVLLEDNRLFVNTIVDITKQKEVESERDNYLNQAQKMLEKSVIHLKNGVG